MSNASRGFAANLARLLKIDVIADVWQIQFLAIVTNGKNLPGSPVDRLLFAITFHVRPKSHSKRSGNEVMARRISTRNRAS